MKVFREIKAGKRGDRGRFWGPKGEGYTNDLAKAGLYDAKTLPDWHFDTVSEIPAVPLLEAEMGRLYERLSAIEPLLAAARGTT